MICGLDPPNKTSWLRLCLPISTELLLEKSPKTNKPAYELRYMSVMLAHTHKKQPSTTDISRSITPHQTTYLNPHFLKNSMHFEENF